MVYFDEQKLLILYVVEFINILFMVCIFCGLFKNPILPQILKIGS